MVSSWLHRTPDKVINSNPAFIARNGPDLSNSAKKNGLLGGRPSLTSRGRMMKENLISPHETGLDDQDEKSSCFGRVAGCLRATLRPLCIISILSIVVFFICDEYFAQREGELGWSSTMYPDTSTESLPLTADIVNTANEFHAVDHKSYLDHPEYKKSLLKIQQLSQELENVKRSLTDLSSTKEYMMKTERELAQLKEKLNKMQTPTRNQDSWQSDPDWGVMELGTRISIVDGIFDPYHDMSLAQRMVEKLSPQSEKQAVSNRILQNLVDQGPTAIMLQSTKNDIVPGSCYPMNAKKAILEVKLPFHIHLSGITLHHLPIARRARGRFSAPRMAEVKYTIKVDSEDPHTESTEILSGIQELIKNDRKSTDIAFSPVRSSKLPWNEPTGKELITIPPSEHGPTDTIYITLTDTMDPEVDFMCLYRLSVHGKPQ